VGEDIIELRPEGGAPWMLLLKHSAGTEANVRRVSVKLTITLSKHCPGLLQLLQPVWMKYCRERLGHSEAQQAVDLANFGQKVGAIMQRAQQAE
jgi:hypothetical protein